MKYETTIKCPECGRIQKAEVTAGYPWNIYVHHCECGYIITESEWEEITKGNK